MTKTPQPERGFSSLTLDFSQIASVRRIVPVPKEYYWITGNTQLPMWVKLWHNAIFYLGAGLLKAEAAGEVVANALGLNDGPFEYVTDHITEEEMARSRAHIENRTAERNQGAV